MRYSVSREGVVTNSLGLVKKTTITKNGYESIRLSIDRITKNYYVHRIVAETYLYKPLGSNIVVNHIDGDKLNNHCSNLEWVTQSYNVLDGFKRGRIHGRTKLDASDRIFISQCGIKTKELSFIFNVSVGTINRVKREIKDE